MFYVSQLAVKLGKFENASRNDLEKIYMTLTWEVVTRVRRGYEYGWKYVKDRLSHMFSHSVLFELLNHNVDNKHMDYIGYYEKLNGTEEDRKVASEIKRIIEMYRDWIPMNYPEIKENHDEESCLTSKALRDLFETIDYQFINGGRKSHYNGYNRKYIDFVQKNFGKFRGTVGYTLSVNENDIIMFTKIILKQYDGRVRLSVLFNEFEQRGLLFDRESRKMIVDLFEKMDLLEKRSDSGDAQYVKCLL
jgi:DNA phosphorothioation-dependent restriction protein DptG